MERNSDPNVLTSSAPQNIAPVAQAQGPRVIEQSFVCTLGTGLGCNCFSCMCLCFGMMMAMSQSMHIQTNCAFFGMIATIVFMVAGSVVFCCQNNEMYVKRIFVAIAGCVAFVQVILLITALATTSTTADAICSNGVYPCYSSVTLNCKCDTSRTPFCDKNIVTCFNQNATMSKYCDKLVTSLWDPPEDNHLEESYSDPWRGFKSKQACLDHTFDNEDDVQGTVLGVACCICWCLMCGLFPAGASAGRAVTPYKDLVPLTQGSFVQPAHIQPGQMPGVVPQGWIQHTDQASGRPYYSNPSTGATTWDFPGGAQPAQGTVVQAHVAPQYEAQDPNPQPQPQPGDATQLAPNWVQHTDPSSGNSYYCNTVTQETTWDRPTVNGIAKN